MARPRDTLPDEAAGRLRRLVEMSRELERITKERDRLLLETAQRYGINATARGLQVSRDVMHKRIARIRRTVGGAQHPEAA